VSITVAAAIYLSCIRYAAEAVMCAVFNWPENSYDTKNAASSVGSIVHSSTLVPCLIACFWHRPYNPCEDISATPRWYNVAANATLQFTTGYMLYDTFLNVFWLQYRMNPNGLGGESNVFLIHHLITVLYMSSTRIYGAGHQSAMICMLLGEITNPLHNAFYIAEGAQGLECCNGALSQMMFYYIHVAFSALYFVVRAIVAPPMWIHLTYVLWRRKSSKVPYWLVGMWTALIWIITIGAYPYVIASYHTVAEVVGPYTARNSEEL